MPQVRRAWPASCRPRSSPATRTTAARRRGCRFEWGSFIFQGVVDSMDETLDYFSEEGVPLRATVSLEDVARRHRVCVWRRSAAGGARRRPAALAPPGQSPLARLAPARVSATWRRGTARRRLEIHRGRQRDRRSAAALRRRAVEPRRRWRISAGAGISRRRRVSARASALAPAPGRPGLAAASGPGPVHRSDSVLGWAAVSGSAPGPGIGGGIRRRDQREPWNRRWQRASVAASAAASGGASAPALGSAAGAGAGSRWRFAGASPGRLPASAGGRRPLRGPGLGLRPVREAA